RFWTPPGSTPRGASPTFPQRRTQTCPRNRYRGPPHAGQTLCTLSFPTASLVPPSKPSKDQRTQSILERLRILRRGVEGLSHPFGRQEPAWDGVPWPAITWS